MSAPSKRGPRKANVNGNVLTDVMAFIHRFVVMSDEQLLITALWIVHTHALDAAQQTPYLLVTSPEKACGKSRLIEVVGLLVARPWDVVLPSEAVLYRTVDAHKPTLLLDEVDAIFASGRTSDRYEGVRALLNAGHRRGAQVPRCSGPTSEVVSFHVFCPKLIAGIGTLPDTVADRGVPIRLQRKTRKETVERFIRRDEQHGTDALRKRLASWAKKHKAVLADARPTMPDELSDRLQEGCEPLVAIADRLGYGKQTRAALVTLCSGERIDNAETMRLRLLRDIRNVFEAREKVCCKKIKGMPSTVLLKRLRKIDDGPWAHYYGRRLEAKDLADLLRPYGVQRCTIRFGDKTKKGYRRSDLVQVWERYL